MMPRTRKMTLALATGLRRAALEASRASVLRSTAAFCRNNTSPLHQNAFSTKQSFQTGRRSFATSRTLKSTNARSAADSQGSSSSAVYEVVPIAIDGKTFNFSAHLLRDACQCPACVHHTSNQRLFAQADVPASLNTRSVKADKASDTVSIEWVNDAPTSPENHVTTLSLSSLRDMAQSGAVARSQPEIEERQILWPLDPSSIPDYDYNDYMRDDKTLYNLMCQLRVNGLAFVTNSPQTEASVSNIATRMGPIKDTFYGVTWDVRTVPEAINAAYTSSDLGFHTDLLYFQQSPHIQLLHCVQSASTGGASVFTDAHKAAVDLFNEDFDAFNILATTPVNYHYNHPQDNVYRTTKPVIGMKPLRVGNVTFDYIEDYINAWRSRGVEWTEQMLVDCLDKCNWGPPFSAPFSLDKGTAEEVQFSSDDPLKTLNSKVRKWHAAAVKFNALLQRSEYQFERKMDPGDCVLFDNTRTLHSRKAFDQADVGKPRWLRGTYVDKDPFLSKMRVLQNQYG